jgi:acetoin utilization protein AcuB
MFVRMWMTEDVITTTPDQPIMEAFDLMKQHLVRRLPVIEKGKVVGIVTQGDIQHAGPSGATSLSIWELNYLLARISVGEVMTSSDELVTVNPDEMIERAAMLLRKNRIGGLPVVGGDDILVGIITESDLFDVLIEVMGIDQDGTRLTLELEERPGSLRKVLEILRSHDANILSIVTCEKCRKGTDHRVVLMRIDMFDWRPIVKDLKDNNIKVLDAQA